MTTEEHFPPIVCRLLARHDKLNAKAQRALTDEEISERSGLRLDQVRGISMLYDWEHIPTDVMHRFSRACGVDFRDKEAIRKHIHYVRRVKWLTGSHFLKRDPAWLTRWKPMIEDYIRHIHDR